MITARILWAMVPDWLRATGAVAVVAVGVYAAGHHMGKRAERMDRAVQDAADHIQTRERIDNALDNPTGCAWVDRLRGTCQ